MKKTFVLAVLMVPFFPFFLGCGSKAPEGFPKVYPTTVIVEQDGIPVNGALVYLSGTGHYPSSGETDATGRAVIGTKSPHYSAKGAPIGQYSVYLSKEPELPSKVSDEERDKMEPAQIREYTLKLRQERANTKRPLPEILEDKNRTPLTIEVTEKGGELKINISDHTKN